MSEHNPLVKYFSEQSSEMHGGVLSFPGGPSGLPFLGDNASNLTKEERENLPVSTYFKSRMFKMWEPEDKKAFDDVMDHITSGWFYQRHRADNWVPEKQHYLVWLEWVQAYHTAPKGPTYGFRTLPN